jgi:hypothetical protein
MGGFLLALIVAIADFYFLFKKMFRLEKKEHAEALNKYASEQPKPTAKPKSEKNKKRD